MPFFCCKLKNQFNTYLLHKSGTVVLFQCHQDSTQFNICLGITFKHNFEKQLKPLSFFSVQCQEYTKTIVKLCKCTKTF